MYDGIWVGFYVCEYAEVYLYVGLYKYVDIYDGHEEVFFVVCLDACEYYKDKIQLFCIH